MIKCRAVITAMIPGALALAPQVAQAQQFTRPAPITAVPAPVILDTTGLYLERAARVGEDIFVTGQPTERALRELRAQGVTTVVNLRTPEEMTRNVPFDEPALVKELGMRYVFCPCGGPASTRTLPPRSRSSPRRCGRRTGKCCCTVPWRGGRVTCGLRT